MYQFTAAHKSLPLPTYAQVTHLGNGRTVLVRINDRGPFKDDRIIDLSYAAARKLGMIEAGTAQVEIVALNPGGAEPRPVVTQTSGIYLQLGAFGSRENALSLLQRLRNQGISDAHLSTGLSNAAQTVHRVRVGPFVNAELAEELAARIVLMGFEHPRVIFD
jgi:rare lipoprotein A